MKVQCPNCDSYDTTSISPRHMARVLGTISLVLGFALLIVLIGIVFMAVGVALLGISFFLPANTQMRCRNCRYTFEARK